MLLGRRSFLTGFGAVALAAPAIVHAGNLMPVKALKIIRAPSEFELELIEAAKQLGREEIFDAESLRTLIRHDADQMAVNYLKSHPRDLDVDHNRIVRYEAYSPVWSQFQRAA